MNPTSALIEVLSKLIATLIAAYIFINYRDGTLGFVSKKKYLHWFNECKEEFKLRLKHEETIDSLKNQIRSFEIREKLLKEELKKVKNERTQ